MSYASFLAIPIALVLLNRIVADPGQRVRTFCRQREKFDLSDKPAEYSNDTEIEDFLLVDAEINSTTIVLECRFCDDESKDQPQRLWYWQDLSQTTNLTEVELGMDNNLTQIRVHMTAECSLIIRHFFEDDVGLYRCIADKETKSPFNYRLEVVLERESMNSTERGNEIEWEKYRETNLLPITQLFAKSNDEELLAIRKEGVALEMNTEWGPWGPCEECVKNRGNRSRRAFCRIKSQINEAAIEKADTSEILQFFLNSPVLSCRSRALYERFPGVSNATRYLSEFVLTEKCKPCEKVKKPKKNKFKYKKRLLLDEGAGLAVPCPEATVLSDVVWRKESLLLLKGQGISVRKKDPEPRIFADPYFTLYLKDVSKHEQGNYSCTVDGVRMLQVKLTVSLQTKVGIAALLRHFVYLAIVLIFSLAAYCYGVVNACKNRKRFRIQTYEQLKEEKQ